MPALDTADLKLLDLLQRDGQMTAQALAERVHLSASQVARRKQRLEADGIIRAYRAHIDPKAVGLTVQAFVQVQTATHNDVSHRAFLRLTETRPEIIAAWTLTGEADYLLRIICTDLSALNRLVQEVLLPHPAVGRVQSQIVMDEIKPDSPLPT